MDSSSKRYITRASLIKHKKSKQCTTIGNSVPPSYRKTSSDSLLTDMLINLPDELLIRILSFLPTKKAFIICSLSKKMMRDVFPYVTTLDLDEFLPIPYYSSMTFVDYVLRNHRSQYLTRFRLVVGPEYEGTCCLPDLNSMKINAWISYPISHYGLRELDLHIRLKNVGPCQLPPEFFTCETLEVLKLDINLRFDRVSAMSSFCLPNLKLLSLIGAFISVNGFLTKLVSSCPLLEDLTVEGRWNNTRVTSISSPLLRSLCLYGGCGGLFGEYRPTFVVINTPNLEYLDYTNNVACHYSITNADHLVKPDISIEREIITKDSFQQMLSFIRPLSNVQQLALNGVCLKALNFSIIKDQLPMFNNLKYLELYNYGAVYWDKLLLAFLNCSPILETLVFPQGFMCENYSYDRQYNYNNHVLEREFCRTTQAVIPSCCRYHLKRIVIKVCFGYEREIDLIEFLLRHALVLKELVITPYAPEDQFKSLESRLHNFQKASLTCSIQVQGGEIHGRSE